MRFPVAVLMSALVLTLLLPMGGCMTPVDEIQSGRFTVRVVVQDKMGAVQNEVLVGVFQGTSIAPGAVPIDSRYTNREGMAEMQLTIPIPSGPFVFEVGNENKGRKRFPMQLNAADTTLILVLDVALLECNVDVVDTLAIPAICAPLKDGRWFADSMETSFRSGCVVPLTVTYQPLNDPFAIRMRIFDDNGREVTTNPFTLPTKGGFTIRVTAQPQAPGDFRRTIRFEGTGEDDAGFSLSLLVTARSIECTGTTCRDTLIYVEFPDTRINSQLESNIRQVEFAQNQTPYVRHDRIVRPLAFGSPFSFLDSLRTDLTPGMSQNLRIRFMPGELKFYRDTLLLESEITETGQRCRSMLIMQGIGCEPTCTMYTDKLVPDTSANSFKASVRLHPYDLSYDCTALFANTGKCGKISLALDTAATGVAEGFRLVTPVQFDIYALQQRYFQFEFFARDKVVWPNGHGRPAVTTFQQSMRILACGPPKYVRLDVTIDTLPIQYSRCIYQWNENGQYGFAFEPYASKGADVADPNYQSAMSSDLVLRSINEAHTSVDVQLRCGWKRIKSGVSESEFTFDAVKRWPEYLSISTGSFLDAKTGTFAVRDVFAFRNVWGNLVRYSLVRIREISVDGDNKHKICIDVMYPMISEGGG